MQAACTAAAALVAPDADGNRLAGAVHGKNQRPMIVFFSTVADPEAARESGVTGKRAKSRDVRAARRARRR
jgi:hypothetical protein